MSCTCCGPTLPCCPGVTIPRTLYAVFTGDITITMTYDGTHWIGTGIMNCGTLMQAVLDCGVFQPTIWTLTITYAPIPGGAGITTTPSSLVCNPFNAVFNTGNIVGPPGGCPASYTVTVHG